MWAAAELFLTTGGDDYHWYFLQRYNQSGVISSSMNWNNVRTLAQLSYLIGSQPLADSDVKTELAGALNNYCNDLLSRRSENGFGITINPGEYYWGSNSDVLNKALILILGYQLSNNQEYLNAALDQLNYILGINAHNFSFITGIGVKSVMNPHHRHSAADGIEAPVPGLLAGGPNQYLNDPVLLSHFNSSTPPALCYIDDVDSYASNETAINWNAPLVFVAGYFNNGFGVSSIINEKENSIPGSIQLEQNYPNPFNSGTTINYYLNKEDNIIFKIFSVTGAHVFSKYLGFQSAGKKKISWNGTDGNGNSLSSGIYFFQINGSKFSSVKKLILMK